MGIVLLVLFVMVMFLWLLAMLGAVPGTYSPWLGWFACLFLGLAVFVFGTQTIVRLGERKAVDHEPVLLTSGELLNAWGDK